MVGNESTQSEQTANHSGPAREWADARSLGCSAGAADCRSGVNGERTFASVKRGLAYRSRRSLLRRSRRSWLLKNCLSPSPPPTFFAVLENCLSLAVSHWKIVPCGFSRRNGWKSVAAWSWWRRKGSCRSSAGSKRLWWSSLRRFRGYQRGRRYRTRWNGCRPQGERRWLRETDCRFEVLPRYISAAFDYGFPV